jgi:hypothetical protein
LGVFRTDHCFCIHKSLHEYSYSKGVPALRDAFFY